MTKKEKSIVGVVAVGILLLTIACINLFKENNELKSRITLDKEYVMARSSNYLAKDYILLILTRDNIDIDELYQALGFIDATKSYVMRFLGHDYDEIYTYLRNSENEITKLIELIKSKADNNAIESQIDVIIQLQNKAIEMYNNL